MQLAIILVSSRSPFFDRATTLIDQAISEDQHKWIGVVTLPSKECLDDTSTKCVA